MGAFYYDSFHHPKPEVYQRYGDLGITRLRTDDAGAIVLHLDDTLTFSEYRQTNQRYWYGR